MKCFRAPLLSSSFYASIILSLVFTAAVAAQTVQDSQVTGAGTDLRFHKFQPPVAPENALTSAAAQASPDALAQQQILALEQDKTSRTPAQQKIDSNVLYTVRMLAGQPAAAGIPTLNTGIDVDNANNLIVDITANVSNQLLRQLNAAGALVWYSNAKFHSIRAVVPSNQIETIAAWPDIVFIAPKAESLTASRLHFSHDPVLRPTFAQRADRVRKLLAMALQARAAAAGTNGTGQGAVTTEGDATHRAFDARGTFAVNGSGLKIGVLSDSANATGALTAAQTSGDMPPNCPAGPPCFTMVQDFAGGADEGLAMMEIIYDMAPGASLFFATADVSEASFAQNILNLRAAGCDIIVDDVFYFDEPVFQDGIVAQSVASVTADGALYFSSAGNEGNIDSNTAGYFEGDFNDTGAPAFTFPGGAKTGTIHNFGTVATPVNGDIITARGNRYTLNWADPSPGALNDYDLFLVSSAGVVKASSTNIQNGSLLAFEQIVPPALAAGDRLVVFKTAAAAPVFFAINTIRGRLTVNTTGQTHGHSAVDQVGMFSVAATPAAQAFSAGFPVGPFPNPFNATNGVELFTSDGPRRVFFNADGSPITPGNFSSTGGTVRNKPDITGADGVHTTLPAGSGLNPFFGTSAAAPSAASVAALVKSSNPALTQADIRNALTSSAIDIMAPGYDRDSGNGIVMAWEALSFLGTTGAANPQLGTVTSAENPGNGNGVIEAGEGGVLSIQLKNTSGVVDATGITATLTTSTPGVTVTQPGTSAYPDLAAGSGIATNTTPFTFTVASDAACGLTINFTLTVNYTGGPQRVATFSVPTGMVTLSNNLGTLPTGQLGITTATGQQTNRVTRNGVASACGVQKTYPGTTTTAGTRTFDSYSFTACKSTCVTPVLTSGNGVNIFEVAYAGTFNPASISTNYAADPGLSGSPQSFGVSTTASNQYTIVVSDVPGTAAGTNYTLQLPACVLNCNINQVPVALAHDVTVTSATPGGSANASIDNGSSDPDGDTLTITQSPAGPYPHGNTTVLLTVTDTKGATSQASAVVNVVDPVPPILIKAFSAAGIPLNGLTSLSFTIQNNNTTLTLTGVGFSDPLPAGLVISTPNGLTGSCGGGTITATQGANVISLSGASLAASSSCTFSVNVTGTTAGLKNNTTGNVTSIEGGTGGTASASVTVEGPPSIAKIFAPSTISVNATTSLTFTITNPAANVDPLTGVAFTDTLPTGLTVTDATSTVCGGTLTTTAPTGIALSGATINTNSQCQFSVTVTGAASGQYTNTTGNVTSTNGGTGNTASASLTVATPPTVTKAFGAASILLNASTSLTFNISNPNVSLGLTGISVTDTLPAGLQVATPNGLTNTCGGTATAAAGSGSISLSGASLAGNASCSISVNVRGIAAGVQNNTTGPISATESGAGATSNTASITVIGPPSIAKAFGAASINLNGTTTLAFTITNPNATVALTGVAFGDTLPAGLAVATPNGLTGSCGAGTITTGTVSGSSVVNLAGGTIAGGGSCTFSVNVVGSTGGHKVNTTGTVTSTNAGSGNQATAAIGVVAPDLTITKTHTGNFNRSQTGATYTITVSNIGFGPTSGTVTVTDTLPNVANTLVPTAISGTGWSCTLATLACTRSDALASGSSYPAITLTVNVPQNIQANVTNSAAVSGGGDVNPNNNTASDPTHVGPPLQIVPSNNNPALTVTRGSPATMDFIVDSSNGIGAVTFACSGLPAASSCSFNPPSESQLTATVTMTITTAKGSAGTPVAFHPPSMLYFVLASMTGLLGFMLYSMKSFRRRARLAMFAASVMVLLALAGCGDGMKGTPKGTFPLTVTANGTGAQATVTVNLTVQ
jgi:hypothetical protein